MTSNSNNGGHIPPPAAHPQDPYANPTSLLKVYPIMTHVPTANVASHIVSHTTVYPNSSSSDELYPQHSDEFRFLDRPSSDAGWSYAREAEVRGRQLLANAGSLYGSNYQSTPDSSSFYAKPQPFPSSSSSGPQPMPYSFIPGHYRPQTPLTPMSASTPSPSENIPSSDYFESYIKSRQRQSSSTDTPRVRERMSSTPSVRSVSLTPCLARTMSHAALDEDSSDKESQAWGPSPTKKRKSIPNIAGVLNQRTKDTSPNELSSTTAKSKARLMVEVPTRKRELITPPATEDGESVDWGDSPTKLDEDGDWGMDSPKKRFHSPDVKYALPQSTGRTVERDTRSAYEKLHTLLEDIFEESDMFPAEPSVSEIKQSKFFHSISSTSLPLLSPQTIDKVTRHLSRLNSFKRTKRIEESVKWDEESLMGLMRLLERGMREADGMIVFEDGLVVKIREEGKKKKGKRGKGKAGKETKDEITVGDGELEVEGLSETKLEELEGRMGAVRDAALCAQCALVLLDCDGLSKQLYSEDFVSLCVSTIKDQMTNVIYPFVQGLCGERVTSSYLSHLLILQPKKTSSQTPRNPYLQSIILSTTSTLPHLASLISRSDMSLSEDIIIKSVYLSIGPFFVGGESGAGGAGRGRKADGGGGGIGGGVLKGLRGGCLGCLRGAFAKYENQRSWIIEEILGSIVKIPDQSGSQSKFQLTNGSSIHTITALLLQLIQASTYGVALKIRKLRTSTVDAEGNQGKVDSIDEEMVVLSSAIEGCIKCARDVVSYLLQKSGTSKANKSSHDADYKAVLDIFVADLLTVLYLPEWPGAAIFLSVISRMMISVLEDHKSGSEASSARSIALDHLGEIASRLRSLHLQMTKGSFIPSLDEIISLADVEGEESVIEAQATVRSFLVGSKQDDLTSSAADLSSVIWAQELLGAIKKTESVVSKLKEEDGSEEMREKLAVVGQGFKVALRDLWTERDYLFEISDPNQAESALKASIGIARGRSLQSAFEPIVKALLNSMDSSVVGVRSKALRGLGGIITVDPNLLGMSHIRQAIENRLEDQSPAVRDAAVELVGKYIVQSPDLATEYYPLIALRATDTGLGVRKRVLKLLKGIFVSTDSRIVEADICCKMIDLIQDHDDNVKEIAVKSLAEIMFPQNSSAKGSADLLVEVLGVFSGSNTILEAALHEIGEVSDRSEVFAQTTETLIERLDHDSTEPDFDALSHVRAIYLLSGSQPAVVDVNKAKILLGYLLPPLNSDDQAKNETLLKIFKKCIPHLPKAASSFAEELTGKLLPMIGRPAGGFQALKETIECFCLVTIHLTKDYTKLINVLRSCEGSSQASAMVLFIIALIIEHTDLDNLSHAEPVISIELGKITNLPISEYVFDLFLDFSKMSIPQTAPILCLGAVFKAHPRLILDDRAKEWTDKVFAGQDEDDKARVLGVIYEFLVSQSEKKAGAGEGIRDVNALMGNAVTLSESAFSIGIVQRNVEHIFSGAKSQHPATQNAAFDVLAFTVTQGLYNPLECLPVLISLETGEPSSISDRAFELHSTLHSKHSSLINVKFLDFAKASFDYQKSLTSEVSGDRYGVALLNKWYSLINEKKTRSSFLKAFCKVFEWDVPENQAPPIEFVLYIAENLATIEYKLQEEIIIIVQLLCAVVSDCTGLANALEFGHLEGNDSDSIGGKMLVLGKHGERVPANRFARGGIVIGLAILVKNQLEELYGLPEDRCLKHELGKKSVFSDKPASKKGQIALDISRIPFIRGGSTVKEFKEQQVSFLQLVQEDGAIRKEHSREQ